MVDDEAEIADYLRELLEAAGHGVAVAHDGAEALRHLELQDFDAVLMDLKMPGMDGPALHREIAARHPALLGRIAAMTGDLLSAAPQAFLRDSALPVLHKPFEPGEVEAMVGRLGRRPAGSA